MSAYLSEIATAQGLSLTRGAGYGASAPSAAANLRILDDKITLANAAVIGTGDTLQFGKVPAGAKIARNLCLFSTTHSTGDIAGTLSLVPLDGGTVQAFGAVTFNRETTETTSVADAADSVVVEKDSYVRFVPGGSHTMTAERYLWARIVYGQLG